MLLPVMRECRRFFEISTERGDFSLAGGKIALDGQYKAGQYILLSGSLLVDGVHKIAAVNNGVYSLAGVLPDEEWAGAVYGLRIPPDFLALCEKIQAFAASEAGQPSNYTSETVSGVHSWQKATGKDGMPLGWQAVFAKELAPFRRMFANIKV